MRIIIFTDSLGRPRPDLNDQDCTYYEDVYGYKLKQYFENDEVELLYIESLDSEDAIHWAQRMVAFRAPDLVVFHLGINDCAPRLFKKGSKSILFNPFFQKITFNIFVRAISYFRKIFTKIRPLVYVDKKDFKNNFEEIITEIKKYNSKVEFISISIAKSDYLDSRSFNYNKNVIEYNKILKEIFKKNYIEMNDIISEDGFISDHVHLTKEAHHKLYEILKQKIKELKRCVE